MTECIKGIERIGNLAANDPWIAYLVACERRLIEPEVLVRPIDNPLGVELANGHIPNAENAGVVEVGSELFGIDHVGCEILDDGLFLFPTSKDDVDSSGNIVGAGLIIAANRDGRVKVLGAAYNTLTHPFYLDRARRSRARRVPRGIIDVHLMGLDTPREFEVKDILGITQLVAPRKHHY